VQPRAFGSFFCLLTGFFKTVWVFFFYIIFIAGSIIVGEAVHTRNLGLISHPLSCSCRFVVILLLFSCRFVVIPFVAQHRCTSRPPPLSKQGCRLRPPPPPGPQIYHRQVASLLVLLLVVVQMLPSLCRGSKPAVDLEPTGSRWVQRMTAVDAVNDIILYLFILFF
jgi:hypothetical protein